MTGDRVKSYRPERLPFLESVIAIPAKKKELLIKDIDFSARLSNILNANGFIKLGDLDSVPYIKIFNARNCGIRTVSELFDFIEIINAESEEGIPHEGRPNCFENSLKSKIISIPEINRARAIQSEPLSNMLKNCLVNLGIKLTGDLHGRHYQEMLAVPSLGQKTLSELEAYISYLSGSDVCQYSESIICIPARHHYIKLEDLPLSGRLLNVLLAKRIRRLGELQGVSYEYFYKEPNFGRKCRDELKSLVKSFQTEATSIKDRSLKSLITSGLFSQIDALASELTERKKNILKMRFSGDAAKSHTLEEIGQVYNLTRERVRQIVEKILTRWRRTLRIRCPTVINNIESLCEQKAFPILPDFVLRWLSEGEAKGEFPPIFYLRLIKEMFPELPVWVDGFRYERNNDRLDIIIGEIRAFTEDSVSPVALRDLFCRVQGRKSIKNLRIGEYFRALENCQFLVIDFSCPDSGTVLNRNVNRRYWARAVLEKSDVPLTAKEILDGISKISPANLLLPTPGGLANSLLPENGFFLLGPRAFGLRKHFRLPESLWKLARKDCYHLLKRTGRPTSTTEIVASGAFEWAEMVNAYELAQILREDQRFLDLGRFLFSLSIWGIEERTHVHDLLPVILSNNNQPMHASIIIERLGQLRSASPTSISTTLRKDLRVQDYGFGYYGLKEWGDTKNDFLVRESTLIERIVRRADPPLSFGELCDVMRVKANDSLVQKLWETVKTLRKIKLKEDTSIFEAEVRHQNWSLEKAIRRVLEDSYKPLLPYEIKWALNDKYGFAFLNRREPDIQRCLRHNPLFVRDQKGAYLLNKQMDYFDLDVVSIKSAVFDILKSKNEIVGCDDLLERLESSGIEVDELSPSMLGALLRSFDAFEEVGINRFRIIKWKR